MLDNDAPYSAIGIIDLCSRSNILARDLYGELESIPSVFCQFLFWQYGSGEHHCEARPILGPVVLSAYAADGTRLLIRQVMSVDRHSG